RLARQLSRGIVQLVGAVLEPEFGEYQGSPAKSIGLDDVSAGLQIRAMNPTDDVRPCHGQDFRAILTSLVVRLDRKGNLMNHGSHGAIDHENAALEGFDQGLKTVIHSVPNF